MVTAKPVVKNKFWILKDEDRKIGTVEKGKNAFVVRIADQEAEFKTIKTIKNKTNIIFEDPAEKQKQFENQINGFPTHCKPNNPIYDVKQRLPLYTKNKKSKSWYAAGYYRITVNNRVTTVFCPKLIMLQRYPYIGPVKSRDGFTFK